MDQSQQSRKFGIIQSSQVSHQTKTTYNTMNPNLQNQDSNTVDKRLSRRAQRQKLAIAGFAQLQKSAFETGIGAQDTDLMKSILSLDPSNSGLIAKQLLQALNKEAQSKKAGDFNSQSNNAIVHRNSQDTDGLQHIDVPAKSHNDQRLKDSDMDVAEDHKAPVKETSLEQEAKINSEEHKKDTDESKKVPSQEGCKGKGSLIPSQNCSSSPEDSINDGQRLQSTILNNQNQVLQKQIESLFGRQQKSPNNSQSQNISSIFKKILKNYSKDKNRKVANTQGNQDSSGDQIQSKTNQGESSDSQMQDGNQQFEELDQNISRKIETEINTKIKCQLISFNDSKNNNCDKQMHDNSNLQAKAQLLRQLSGQVMQSAGQKLQDMGFDNASKNTQLQSLLMQEILKGKGMSGYKDTSQSAQIEKGTFKTAMNSIGEVPKVNDLQEPSQSKEIQNSLSKFLGIQSINTVHVQTAAKKGENEDINNFENIENRKQSNSSNERQNIAEILTKLQNIQKQSSQQQNNRDFHLQQKTEAVNSLKNLKSILAERSAAQQALQLNQQNASESAILSKLGQLESFIQRKDTIGQENNKTQSPNTIQLLNRSIIKKDIPANQSLDKSVRPTPDQNNEQQLPHHPDGNDVEMNIKGKNESDASALISQTEPRKEEKHIQLDCEMSSENQIRKNSKIDSKSAVHLHEQVGENQEHQKGSQYEKMMTLTTDNNKKSEERAREEISSLMNLIKSNINANSKYKNLSAEDNGALWSIMSKLEGSIGMNMQNKNNNSFDANEKDKPSVPGQSQERPSESHLSESKLQQPENGLGANLSLMNSEGPQSKPAFNSILQQQIRDTLQQQQQQLQSKSSSNQDSSHLQFPAGSSNQVSAQKGSGQKTDYSTNGATTTAGYTESNLTTIMSGTNNGNSGVKGSSKGPNTTVVGPIQAQASLGVGEPTATAVTRQTSFEAIDPRIKKMQSGFLLNNSSPLGKFNAQSSQIIESHQNIFRVPQSHQQQAVPVATSSCQNSTEKYGQFKQIIQMLQAVDGGKKDAMQGGRKESAEFDSGAKRDHEDKQVDSGIAAVARQAPRASQTGQAALKLPISSDLEQKLKQSLSPQQMSQIKSIPGLAQLLNLDTPDSQMSPSKAQQPALQEPPSGNILKKLVLGNQNDQLQRSLSLQSNDYLASLASSVGLNGQNSHNQAPSSAVGGVSQGAPPPAHGANQGVTASQDGAAVAMNQQMLKAVRQFLVHQQNQQEATGSRSVQGNQIQQLINALTNEQQMGTQQENNTLASLRRTLSGTANGAGLQGLLQQAKQNELASAQQTPLNQLLGFQGGEKSAAILSQVKALGLDLSSTPVRADSFVIKDIDSPSKMRMRTFLDRQRSTTTMNEYGKTSFEGNADVQHNKQNQLQSLLLGASPNRNNQELSLLQNMINDEEDDRFGNIKMSDEEISPQENINPGDGFLTGGPRLVVSHRSKGIKKDHGFAHLGHGGYAPHPTLALGQSHSYEAQNITEGLLRSSDEKIQDKGEYYLIHRMNTKTKRLNQILQCKLCPMKFPKLCNLRDHVRIHKEDMPFKCSLCSKAFTQAGNRDRHESKRVCLRRNNNQNSPTKRADDGSDVGYDGQSPTRTAEQLEQPQSQRKVEAEDQN